MNNQAPKRPPSEAAPPANQCVCVLSEAQGVRKIASAALFGQSSCLMIEHGETVYFLRATKFGKLILTK